MNLNFREDLMWYSAPVHVRNLAIEHGLTTIDDMKKADTEFKEFLEKLSKEWPTGRIDTFVRKCFQEMLEMKRAEYSRVSKGIQSIEFQNKEARVRGVSFKDRRVYTDKLNTVQKILDEVKREGEVIKSQSRQKRPVVEIQPLDVPLIELYGFEKHILRKYGFWELMHRDVFAFSPVKINNVDITPKHYT